MELQGYVEQVSRKLLEAKDVVAVNTSPVKGHDAMRILVTYRDAPRVTRFVTNEDAIGYATVEDGPDYGLLIQLADYTPERRAAAERHCTEMSKAIERARELGLMPTKGQS